MPQQLDGIASGNAIDLSFSVFQVEVGPTREPEANVTIGPVFQLGACQ
jgi:hypothetical protein